MPLSADTINALAQASGFSVFVRTECAKEMDRAAKADNPASSLESLRRVQADLMLLSHRVRVAIEACERDLRSVDDAPPSGAVARALYDGLAPKPKLTVVR